MRFKKKSSTTVKSGRDCANCANPGCPASPYFSGDLSLQARPSDLYDLSINLMDRVILCPEQGPAEFFVPAPARPEPMRPLPPPPADRELQTVIERMNLLSGQVAELIERSRWLENAESDLGRGLSDLDDEIKRRLKSLDRDRPEWAAAELERISRLIDEVRSRSAERESLERVSSELDRLTREQSSSPELEKVKSGLEEARRNFAEASRVDDLAGRVTSLDSGKADREVIAALEEKLESLIGRFALRTDLDQVRETIAESDRAEADLARFDELQAELDRQKARAVEREDLERLRSELKSLAERSVDLELLTDLDERLRQAQADGAPREALEETRRALDELAGRAAEQDEVERLQAQIKELRSRAADRDEFEEVTGRLEEKLSRAALAEDLGRTADKLEELSKRAALRTDVESLTDTVQDLDERAATKDQVNLALGQVKEELARAATRSALEQVSASLAALRDKAATRTQLDGLAEKLADLRERAAEQRTVEALSEDLERFKRTAAPHDLVDKLNVQLAELRTRAADRDGLDRLAATVEELDRRAADREQLNRLAEQVREASSHSADRAALEKLAASVEEVRSRLVDRGQLAKFLDQFKEVSSQSADKEFVGRVLAEVVEIKGAAADKASLEQLSARVEELASQAVERDALEGLAGRLEEMKSNMLDRDQLGRFLTHFKEVSAKWADQERVERLTERVKQAQSRIAELEDDQTRLRRELSESSARRDPTERLLDRITDLEQSLLDLQELAGRSDLKAGLEQRIRSLEEDLVRAVSAAPSASGEPPSLASIKGVDRMVERIKKIEADHEELRRQIIKAFENLSAHPLKELEALKDRLHQVEKKAATPPPPQPAAKGRVTPPPPARRGPAWLDRLPDLPKSRLIPLIALIVLAAGVLGAAVWKWTDANGRANASSDPPAEAADAPNIVYDNLDLALESPTLYIGSEQLALDDGKADVAGYAPGAVKATLYLNGEETATVAVTHQEFDFPAIPLEYGRNVVEVLTEDDNGNKANSLARIIDRMSQKAAKVRTQDVRNRMRGPRQIPNLALTIDAGASNRRATMILDVLKAKGIITTFFLTGQFIERYPDVARRIVADGHEVGNHTFSHPHLTTFEQNRRHQTAPGMTREELQTQLIRTRDLFETVTGAKMTHWWRAPYGEYNDAILSWAHEVGFDHIDWTRSPRNHDMLDWVADTRSPYYLDSDGLYRRLVGISSGPGNANGGIILCHLGTDRDRDFLDLVLPRAIDSLRAKGYEFVTISSLFSE